MRDEGPVRKDLSGDTDAAAPYIGAARTLLGQVKNQMRLGGLQQLARTVTLPDGTSIRAESRLGQDTVRVVAPVGAAVEVPPLAVESSVREDQAPEPPTIEPPEVNGRYLLVIYQGNKVAAIPMASIASNHWPIAYHAGLTQSDFTYIGQSVPVTVLQLNLGVPGSVSVFQAPFDLSQDNVIPGGIAASSLYLNALGKGDLSNKAVKAIATRSQGGLAVVMNASGATVWTQYGQYSVVGNQPVLVQALPDSLQDNTRGVTSAGMYLGAWGARRKVLGQSYPPGEGYQYVLQADVLGNGGVPPAYAGELSDVEQNGYDIAYGYAANFDVSGGGSLDLVVSSTTDSSGVSRHDYSVSGQVMVFSQDGTRDYLTPAAIRPDTGIFRVSDNTTYDTISGSQGINGWSYAYTWEAHEELVGATYVWFYNVSETGYNSINYIGFPPAFDTTKPWALLGYTTGQGQGYLGFSTPYFTDAGGDLVGTFGVWHCSNGRHVLQGFGVDRDASTMYYLYVDRVDAAPRLMAALGVTPGQVNAFVMDVPLDVIKRIK